MPSAYEPPGKVFPDAALQDRARVPSLDHWTYPVPDDLMKKLTLKDWERIGGLIGRSLARAEIDVAMLDKAALEADGKKVQ